MIDECDLEGADAQARERALDPQRSILLQAPAGSGKTTVLTRRFLRLLTDVDEPEEILAITFTRKAAGEMRARILRALRGESAGSLQPLAELAQRARARSIDRGWNLESSPGRLRIQTIDSLNRWLALQLPVAARAIGDLEVSERPLALYRRAARRTLTDAESDPHLQADIESLFERLDNDFDRFERLLTTMLAARAHWLPRLLGDVGPSLTARVQESLGAIVADRLAAASNAIGGRLIEQGVQIVRSIGAHPPADSTTLTLTHWQSLCAIALTGEGSWRAVLTKREGFPAHEKPLKADALRWIADLRSIPGAREILIELATLPEAHLPLDDAAALEALARVLKLAAAELEVIFQESGQVDYAYIAAAARRALTEEGAPTDLSLRLGTRLRHILVDEFQDTSIDQCELLQALTAGWESGDGRSLFIVGDPMQSIYQFREAEVGLFLRTRERGLGALRLETLALTRNFRSVPELVEWANAAFPRVFPERDDPRASAVRYFPSIASRNERGQGGVWLHRTVQGDVSGEARHIAQLVVDRRAREPRASIAVLVAARTHAAPIAKALAAAGIPVAGVDLVSLMQLPVVQDLTALTRALDHLGDRTAWLAVLRAPWSGLTLRELTTLLEGANHLSIWEALQSFDRLAQLESACRARIARVRQVLQEALQDSDRLEPARRIERAWLRLGGPAACASDEDLEHAEAYFDALAAWSAEPDWAGPAALDERLSELYASHAAAPADAVQIMTIHRAKGLEFDTVIVPGLGRRLRATAEPLLRWLELPRDPEGSDLLMAPITPGTGAARAPLNNYLKSLQARRALHERARLLYVAATRARAQLHLFGELREDSSSSAANPPSGTLLATLWPAIAAAFPAEATVPGGLIDPPERRVAAVRRLPLDWRPPAGARDIESTSIAIAGYLSGEDTEPPILGNVVRCVGVVVCDELRRISRGGALPQTAAWRARTSSLKSRLMQLGLSGEVLGLAVERAIEALSSCVADPLAQWLFAATHTEVASPLELTGAHAGRIASVSIDRAFIDAEGTRWLIDFKPGVQSTGEAELFLADELAHARPILERYLAFARHLGSQPARAALYFPLLGQLRYLQQ